jgi:hypothetical protein
MYGNKNEFEEVMGKKQRIKLPFKVKTDFYVPPGSDSDDEEEGWEIQLFDNHDPELLHELGVPTDFFVLSLDMVSVIKPKQKKKRGKMRKVAMTATCGGEEEAQEGEEMGE